ncbi:hypothetical protein CDD83_3018 [Cordyceps sp. RAO-2017]|nr:hypothetical protein CDD83_3018 [Cordyceps sp. RAO-2017]
MFAGGTVYQAILSLLSYHRWHGPVSGAVVRAFVQQEPYYGVPFFCQGQCESEGYLAAVATRAIIVIAAGNPLLGLVTFVVVGMVEVRSCEITCMVRSGQRVAKGQRTGMFHNGGAGYCLLLR